ncbi:hypothetical protein BH10CHL1_BH10CHL1_20970 [soil metagenome]
MTELIQEQTPTRAAKPATQGKSERPSSGERRIVFLHALAFVIGFSVVFTLIGSAAGLIGNQLTNDKLQIIQRLGAILLVIFGLVTLGVFRWLVNLLRTHTDLAHNPAAEALVSILDFFNTLLYTEKRVVAMHQVNPKWGYLSSAMLGVSFSAGWVPCVGPILGSIYLLAQNSTTAGHGAALLGIYSLGLGIPFLLTGAAFSTATRALRRFNRHAGIVSLISGFFLLAVAFMLWNGNLATLTTQFDVVNRYVLRLADWTSNIEMDISSTSAAGDITNLGLLSAAPLAFFAGLLSFLSPCVLPLVPAYIGYLSGAALNSRKA